MGKRNVKTIVLDTNIITRYLIGDVEWQLVEAKAMFRRAEKGEIKLLILPVVVAEVSYVFGTVYHKVETEISSYLQSFLAQPCFELEHEKALLGMWDWYEQGQHFVDSYLLALEKYEGIEVASFDEKLNKKLNKKCASFFEVEKKG
ncbi:MAG: PIN domain-containing protein [Patescibacteria group bacterium]